jgi:serine/threonine-protein kinase
MLTTGRDGAVTPVIMDFGLASQPGSDAPAPISGSPDYMAPEQFRAAATAKSADIYAFGLILFEMIAGARPFPREELLPAAIRRTTEDAPRVCAVAPCAPRAWDAAIARALSRDATLRPGSAKEILDEMEGAPAGRAVCTIRIEGRCRHQPRRLPTRRARLARCVNDE